MTLWVGQLSASCRPCLPGYRGKQCPQRRLAPCEHGWGARWKNSSRRRELSGWGPTESPRSCCIRRRSCVGFRSPSSSKVKRSCRRFLSEAAVCLIRRSVSLEYVSTSGGLRMSRTSVANSLSGQHVLDAMSIGQTDWSFDISCMHLLYAVFYSPCSLGGSVCSVLHHLHNYAYS